MAKKKVKCSKCGCKTDNPVEIISTGEIVCPDCYYDMIGQ